MIREPVRYDVQLPAELGLVDESDGARAVALLRHYFGLAERTQPFEGAHFDTWARDGEDPDVIQATDLLAVGFLSVTVPAPAVRAVLGFQREEITSLLKRLGPDRDLASSATLHENEPATELWNLLKNHDDMGWVTTSKLMARKRPRLIPVIDTVVSRLVGVPDFYWDAWWRLFQEHPGLHDRLVALRESAGVHETLSAIRTLDVLLWMYAKYDVSAGSVQARPSVLSLSDLTAT